MIQSEKQILSVRWLGIAIAIGVSPFLLHGRALLGLWAVCLAAAGYCLVVSRWVLRRRPEWLAHGHVMLAGDVVMAGTVVVLTGGLRSELYLVYFLFAVLIGVRFSGRSTAFWLAGVMASYSAAIWVSGAPPTMQTWGTVCWRLGWIACTAFFASFVINRARAAERQLQASYDATLAALSSALDQRDVETEGHSQRVAAYALRLGREVGMGPAELASLGHGALLHDIGKIGVADRILRKPGPLDAAEVALMQQHPRNGERIIAGIPFLADALPVILQHHEWWNGAGYPDERKGEEIALAARVFAVVDAYDAMTSDRPYRRAVSHQLAVEELLRGSGTQFEPRLVAAFAQIPLEDWREALAARGVVSLAGGLGAWPTDPSPHHPGTHLGTEVLVPHH